MSLSIQSGLHEVAKITHDVEFVPYKKATDDQSLNAPASETKAEVPLPKPAPKLDERARIELLALQGHSNLQIAAAVGLPENEVALTLGDLKAANPATSSASALALASSSGRLSVTA